MNKNRFYVYLHRRIDNNEVFYIGKGTGVRSHKKHNRNKNWHVVVSEAGGFTVEYLALDLTEDLAIALENEKLIKPDEGWKLINKIGAVSELILDKDEILKHLYYSESSPSGLRWVNTRCSNALKDDIAGMRSETGWGIRLNGRRTSSCRFVVILNDLDPTGYVVDHIDGNVDNNNFNNLRMISSALNARNCKQRKDNISGHHGVSFNIGKQAWAAQWTKLDGSRGQKWFSVGRFGYEQAKSLAILYRENAIKELNEQGAGYTDRHGT